MSSFYLAFFAGLLTTFSPCVLPVIPLVVGGASRSSKWGPLFLLTGLALSFAITGTFATAILFSLGIPTSVLSDLGAVLLILVGLFLLSNKLDELFKSASGGLSNKANQWLTQLNPEGNSGQFILGAFIGLVWLPCTGPTLGAAIGLAAQGEELGPAFLTMLSFALGAVIPLAAYAFAGRHFSKRMESLVAGGVRLRKAFAALFVFIGVSIFLGWHKWLETEILKLLPEWWVSAITSI